jgi:hypothetical protein
MWTKAPLAATNPDWNTLFRDSSASGDHQIIVRRVDNIVGMYDNATATGFKSTGVDMDLYTAGWHHLAIISDGSYTNVYVDGSLQGSVFDTSAGGIDVIGNYQVGGQAWGVLDELRIKTGTTVTGNYIITQYQNQNSPSAFMGISDAQAQPKNAGNMLMMFM